MRRNVLLRDLLADALLADALLADALLGVRLLHLLADALRPVRLLHLRAEGLLLPHALLRAEGLLLAHALLRSELLRGSRARALLPELLSQLAHLRGGAHTGATFPHWSSVCEQWSDAVSP
ncbi:hypothetical protein GCM10023335_30420 [Streptomyces siamensis]|uniref:Secreted protein n=1 Tax=Streptomyces siamensis TaxID=1274986 RepID=A0ABP9IVM7_9ACTN